jgi:hypothetical protein
VVNLMPFGWCTTLFLSDPLSLNEFWHHAHDATRQIPAHLARLYSPKCVEGEFSETRMQDFA